MARYSGAVCKVCRREGVELFLKGERCLSPKCGIKKRNYAPGMHGRRRVKHSDYGVQLREKQKMKRTYGLMERQFRNYFIIAAKSPVVTGEKLIQLLEGRLDNVVYRIGFAASRAQARQFVSHAHIRVNDRKVNLPSYQVKPEDTISVREKSRQMHVILANLEATVQRGLPAWVEVDTEKMTGKLLRLPTKEEVALPVQEQLVIELYSR
ncbi:MAG: 30S ribosomal protein S4 [Candidatus Hydrogenedentota bacterium]|nr:MAG: 30S ribosomal protein S4 [Candidatus Hydrogenedentota bacterium]